MIIVGVIVAIMAWQGVTTREEVADFGPIDVTRQETQRSDAVMIGGIVVAAAGLIMLAVAGTRRGAVI
jgi:hypothetical protein